MLDVSDKIEVFLQENKANLDRCRGVRARCDISEGQCLIREQPTVWILSSDEREYYCHHCFVECKLLIQ